MSIPERVAIQFCGFGGQGIVLSSILIGTAAVTEAGLYAVQTQSYGSEARGGECQAEVILSVKPIGSPTADQTDILIAFSQQAYNVYLPRLRRGGTLVIDPDFVKVGDLPDIHVFKVPAARLAEKTGSKIAANMVMLGFLQQATGYITEEQLFNTIRENVRQQYLDTNLQAARAGIACAHELKAIVRI